MVSLPGSRLAAPSTGDFAENSPLGERQGCRSFSKG